MTQTNRRLSALLAALLLIRRSAPARACPRITDEAAMPLQHVIDGVINGDLRTYLSAFPDDYVTAITEEYERSVCPDFTAYMQDFLASALDVHLRQPWGRCCVVVRRRGARPELTESEWNDCFEGYVDYNVIQYRPTRRKRPKPIKFPGRCTAAARKTKPKRRAISSCCSTTANGCCTRSTFSSSSTEASPPPRQSRREARVVAQPPRVRTQTRASLPAAPAGASE